jgi:hypothetical protein
MVRHSSCFDGIAAVVALFVLASCSGATSASAGSQQVDAHDVSAAVISSQVSRTSISKIDNHASFESYFPNVEGDPYLSRISSSFFDDSVLFFAPFACDTDERQNGVSFEGVRSRGNALVFSISVSAMFTDEGFNQIFYLVSGKKDDLASFDEYSYDVYRRDTGEKGSCYYDDQGNLR